MFFRGIALILVLCASPVFGVDRFFIYEKQEEKAKHRWSLAEWLDQRDRMRMMDLWLALHSPSPYEFYLGGEYQTGHFSGLGYYGGWEGFIAGYASIFGLELRYETTNLSSRTSGFVNFRLFGFHAQATNLTVQGGVKNESRGDATLWNPLLGATITLYFTRFVGIEGLYRHFFSSTSHGLSVSGDRFEAGAFIDFQFVRVFGDFFTEQETTADSLSRKGATLGVKIFF
jgi:hypothetical protein